MPPNDHPTNTDNVSGAEPSGSTPPEPAPPAHDLAPDHTPAPQVISPQFTSQPAESAAPATTPVTTGVDQSSTGDFPPAGGALGDSVGPQEAPSSGPAPMVVSGTPVYTQGTGVDKGRHGWLRKRLVLPAVIVLVVLLAGGYVFGLYLPNTPGNVYKTALSRTSQGYDKLVNYFTTTEGKHYKGYSMSGSVKVVSADGSGDGSFSGQSYGGNSTGSLNLDLMGEKFGANFRTVMATGQTTPDTYFQLTGIKHILDSFGLNKLDKFDGQWIVADHTLLESAQAGQTEQATKAASLSYADVQDALQRVGTVNQKYLFTTNNKYAVLKNEKYLGKSTQDGQTVNGYQVGFNKDHLDAYFSALGTALDASKLNAWVKQTTGKTITDQIDLASLRQSIDRMKSEYSFTMYVDTKTKLIHKVHFPSTTDPAHNFMEAGLNYTGGSKYPFVFNFSGKDGSTSTTGNLVLTLDTSTDVVTADMKSTIKDSGSTNFDLNATFKPSNQAVQVSAPKGARPIMEVIGEVATDLFGGSSSGLGSSGFGGASVQSQARDTERQTDLKSLQAHLEAYYAENGSYPTLADINSASWRPQHMQGLDNEALKDPQGSSAALVAKPTKHAYSYQRSSNGQKYTLTAELETGTPYVIKSMD